MKLSFECPKEILIENLVTVQKAIAVKSTIPQLECYYIKAENDKITLIGNNQEISIQTQFNAEIEKCKVGDTVTLEIERDDTIFSYQLTLREYVPSYITSQS